MIAEVAQHIVALRSQGTKYADIAAQVGLTEHRCNEIALEHGLPKRRASWGALAHVPDEVLADLIAQGLTMTRIAERFGTSKNTVSGRVWRQGLTLKIPDPPPPLTDADFAGCRWIDGEGRDLRPGMYCGAPVLMRVVTITGGRRVERRSSYCPEHHARVWRPVEPRDKP